MSLSDLDPEERAIYEFMHGMTGDFKTALFEAIFRADNGNLFLLSKVFPVEVAGYRNYTGVPGWWTNVEKKVHGKDQIKRGEK